MSAYMSSESFRGVCKYIADALNRILGAGFPVCTYRYDIRRLAHRLHDTLEVFAASLGFDVFETEYTHAFDALGLLYAALPTADCRPAQIKAAAGMLALAAGEAVPA